MKRVEHILAALGGVDNVVSIEPCVLHLGGCGKKVGLTRCGPCYAPGCADAW